MSKELREAINWAKKFKNDIGADGVEFSGIIAYGVKQLDIFINLAEQNLTTTPETSSILPEKKEAQTIFGPDLSPKEHGEYELKEEYSVFGFNACRAQMAQNLKGKVIIDKEKVEGLERFINLIFEKAMDREIDGEVLTKAIKKHLGVSDE